VVRNVYVNCIKTMKITKASRTGSAVVITTMISFDRIYMHEHDDDSNGDYWEDHDMHCIAIGLGAVECIVALVIDLSQTLTQ
jgi:hypothetical protein